MRENVGFILCPIINQPDFIRAQQIHVLSNCSLVKNEGCPGLKALFMPSRHDGILNAYNMPLPNLRAELTSSRGHPFPGVVHVLANLPPWNIFHDPRLLLKILLPLFDKST